MELIFQIFMLVNQSVIYLEMTDAAVVAVVSVFVFVSVYDCYWQQQW